MQKSVFGHIFNLDPNDTIITPCLYSGKTFETLTVSLLPLLVKPGTVVVDAGAHIGYYTLLLARLVGATGTVYAFEPNPKTFEILIKNIEINNYKNIIPINKALHNKHGVMTLYENETNTGDSRLSFMSCKKTVQVETTILDDEVKQEISFIKIDTQGFEEYIISSMAKPPPIIVVEYWAEGLLRAGTTPKKFLNTLKNYKLLSPNEEKGCLEDFGKLGQIKNCNLIAIKGNELQEGNVMTKICFKHGLGDVSNFCHQIPLYVKRGFPVEVECTPEKEPLFRAAGASVTLAERSTHPYLHAEHDGDPTLENPWSGSKPAWNVGKSPMPNIGDYRELWEEYCSVKIDLSQFLTLPMKTEMDDYINTLLRPLMLVHFQGNTGTESKNLDHSTQAEIIKGLLKKTDGTILQLDWDNRQWMNNNYRSRHLLRDWRYLDPIRLYYLISKADVLIGIDSGPLHFCRFTSTPAIGLWTKNYPSHFILPREETVNLVPENNLTRLRRIPYNIVEGTDPDFITNQTVRLLGDRFYLNQIGPDLLLRSLVDKCQGEINNHIFGRTWVDRNKSFDRLFRFLRQIDKPNLLETGCIRAEEDYSAGFFTYIFGIFLKYHGGNLVSIELDANNANFARVWTKGLPVNIITSHSHDYLKQYSGPKLNAVYLDSCDTEFPEHEENCHEEVRLILPHLASHAMILIDDTVWSGNAFKGKGAMAIPFLQGQGFKIQYAGYQVLLER